MAKNKLELINKTSLDDKEYKILISHMLVNKLNIKKAKVAELLNVSRPTIYQLLKSKVDLKIIKVEKIKSDINFIKYELVEIKENTLEPLLENIKFRLVITKWDYEGLMNEKTLQEISNQTGISKSSLFREKTKIENNPNSPNYKLLLHCKIVQLINLKIQSCGNGEFNTLNKFTKKIVIKLYEMGFSIKSIEFILKNLNRPNYKEKTPKLSRKEKLPIVLLSIIYYRLSERQKKILIESMPNEKNLYVRKQTIETMLIAKDEICEYVNIDNNDMLLKQIINSLNLWNTKSIHQIFEKYKNKYLIGTGEQISFGHILHIVISNKIYKKLTVLKMFHLFYTKQVIDSNRYTIKFNLLDVEIENKGLSYANLRLLIKKEFRLDNCSNYNIYFDHKDKKFKVKSKLLIEKIFSKYDDSIFDDCNNL